ncbi:type I-F CRISPR-associated endoribonuclease Cas6/Csy4 [Suttonella sp. R2A3]|uniref:type I-F CRISPR-associated endoribonuclease Cas6/Csy4 n=1 Tax=Suttonella sp. R2A3 TaxID=2908648 RepID=UPI001F2EAEEE|nr:type I-F CRISPR-associated endoribonuclease Cas6/Csy4 [Suttonella sp. R2A3]UJF25019.1 type I-F CRISPR-associated endoribonuclease Cas6/Csy4 [Suttonella sp. R2A3]
MNYYQELILLSDPGISPYFIWGKLYKQLHIALANIHNNYGINNIGVSFPNYRFEQGDEKTFATLGNKLRIFAKHEHDLQTLNIAKWLERLTDYVQNESIEYVPDNTGHIIVQRYRHYNEQKQAEKFAAFKDIPYKDALEHCKKYKRDNQSYPFINLKSEGNNHFYKLAIKQEKADKPVQGTFNTYGINNLSNKVTVPHW